uniref:Succinate dehydrogenase subunit 3 n=1 Tax=Deltalsia parasitica TaxID=1424640 RepID=UPI0022FD5362|nr:Succinate dehydrogenase subunit 3 [Deltalsia parasitica]WAX04280.1 Succinate dehydrogenase subunit 3 [Deltalsia parasitica]
MLLHYYFYSLKPFSPYLTIYLNQSSSIFSILHRLSSLLLISFLFCLILFYFFSLNLFFYNFLILQNFSFIIFHFFLIFSLKIGFFHLLNGIKIILWNFTYLQNFNLLTFCNILIGIIFYFFLIFF